MNNIQQNQKKLKKFESRNPHKIQKSISKDKNELKLNQYHQLQKQKKKEKTPNQKIRDYQRLLKLDGISEEKKNQIQLEMNALQGDAQKQTKKFHQTQRKQFFLNQNYKRVKEIERKKLQRNLHKIQKELDETKENQELIKQKKDLVDKLNYIKFFPKDKKYISIFKCESEEGIKQRDALIKLVKEDLTKKILKKKLGVVDPSEIYNQQPKQKKEKKAFKDQFFNQNDDQDNDNPIKSKKQVDKTGQIIREPKIKK